MPTFRAGNAAQRRQLVDIGYGWALRPTLIDGPLAMYDAHLTDPDGTLLVRTERDQHIAWYSISPTAQVTELDPAATAAREQHWTGLKTTGQTSTVLL